MNATSNSTMIDRSNLMAPYRELRNDASQQPHRRIGERHDDLQHHHRDATGLPVAAERPDELDHHPGDQEQPEHEQRKTQDLEEE